MPAMSSTVRIASVGKPAQCFTRRKRSSSTAATSWPSRTNAADTSPWYALIPKTYVTAMALLRRYALTLPAKPPLENERVHEEPEPEALQHVKHQSRASIEEPEPNDVPVDEVRRRSHEQRPPCIPVPQPAS